MIENVDVIDEFENTDVINLNTRQKITLTHFPAHLSAFSLCTGVAGFESCPNNHVVLLLLSLLLLLCMAMKKGMNL
jgi:hypothetical protein